MAIKFSFRAANRSDFERIIDLNLRLFKFESGFNDSLDLSWTLSPEGKKYFSDRLDQINGSIFVAESADKIIAYMSGTLLGKIDYRLEKCVARIDRTFVLADFRHMGIGSGLIEQFENWCKKKGVETILTEISEQNRSGQSFYLKSGFSQESVALEKKIELKK